MTYTLNEHQVRQLLLALAPNASDVMRGIASTTLRKLLSEKSPEQHEVVQPIHNPRPLNIGLDYDGTCTEDIYAWLAAIHLFRSRGHSVYIVTMRYPQELDFPSNTALDPHIRDAVNGVHCTSRQAKGPWMKQQGIDIDIWIDDCPTAVALSAVQIWGRSNPSGSVDVRNANHGCGN